MGSIITDNDRKLVKRLEQQRVNLGLTQDEMAECMECSLSQYKRYIYLNSKMPCEKVMTLANNLPVDINNLIFGDCSSKFKLINALSSSSSKDMAELFGNLYLLYETKARLSHQKTDYIIDDNLIVEIINTINKKA